MTDKLQLHWNKHLYLILCHGQKCDRSADGRLDHGEIEVFCRELLRRPELDAVFIRYSANGCVLSTVDLKDFLKDQGEDASLVHAQSLILTYELNEWGTKIRKSHGCEKDCFISLFENSL